MDASSTSSRLADRLVALRDGCLGLEREHAPLLRSLADASASATPGPAPGAMASSRNLLHYLAIRGEDLRDLHIPLAQLGLSSLGRIESNVLANLNAVLDRLQIPGAATPPPITLAEAATLLERRTSSLLGPARGNSGDSRSVRIMVTLPSEAATTPTLVRDLLVSGMACARINTAHDDAESWVRMCTHVRDESAKLGVDCRILMDLAGPKLRTGEFEPGPQVVRAKPDRDELGRVVRPATLLLRPDDTPATSPQELPVPREWLRSLKAGDAIEFFDTRGRRRLLRVQSTAADPELPRVLTTSDRTLYIGSGTVLRLLNARERAHETTAGSVPPIRQSIIARPGDLIHLSLSNRLGRPADGLHPAMLSCTLPEAFARAKPGEQVCIDDGRVSTVIEEIRGDTVVLRVTRASALGDRIKEDKGINLPDTDIAIHGLTQQDIEVLPIAAKHADIVGMSFVREASDVVDLRRRLDALGGSHLGTILKIETRRAFDNLPHLLLAALHGPSAGVMIARGDLAVEVGYERLGEVQEEILWLCEAAQIPVIWATQVLETMAKTGRPSRAEVTDAAMGERAECVMLNKGPFIVEVVRFLDSLMRRMQDHQSKKRPIMRALGVARRFARRD